MLPDQEKKEVDDKQNEAITAASNELAKRKNEFEENLKLSHDLKVSLGAAWNVANVTKGSTGVIFGLGTVGLSGYCLRLYLLRKHLQLYSQLFLLVLSIMWLPRRKSDCTVCFRFVTWYEKRQIKKIYSPLLEGLLALYLGFEWIQTNNILAPIITHGIYSTVILGHGLWKIHDHRVDYGKNPTAQIKRKIFQVDFELPSMADTG
ncbi:hypothetical protein HN51_004991 [Arachis hypogaea]